MNSEDFVSAIKVAVRDSAIQDTIAVLKDPPGRQVSEQEQLRSAWFNELSFIEQEKIASVVRDAVDTAVFGFFLRFGRR